MKAAGFLLYRLNFVDRHDLFSQRRVSENSDFLRIVEEAVKQESDIATQGRRSGYKWALREPNFGNLEEEGRAFVLLMFSREVTSTHGPIITPRGIAVGTSTLSPPSATLIRVLFDLGRHICAVEDVPSVVEVHSGWKSKLETILSSSAWRIGYGSIVSLDPIIPTEIVLDRLKSFSRVTRLRVTLRLPNPDLGPAYRRLFDEMQKGSVRELYQDMRSERGLAFEPETLPSASLEMAMKGYRKGKIRVDGYADGERSDFTVTDDVARIEIEDLREFVEGYAAGERSGPVKRFARAIIQRIDDSLAR